MSTHLPVPLFHGTSSLFLDGIAKYGLGGKNPVTEWRLLEFARELAPLVETHLAPLDKFMVRAGSFRRMANQFSAAMNFQHGETYLTPSRSTAIRYATSNSHGSELLSYSLEFLRALVDRDVPTVSDSLYRKYPHIFQKLDISVAPVLIQINNVSTLALESEFGGDSAHGIEEILAAYKDDSESVDDRCQQSNFRLRVPIPKADLSVWLVAVARWDPFQPDYELFPVKIC